MPIAYAHIRNNSFKNNTEESNLVCMPNMNHNSSLWLRYLRK
jgi:hypothetical protein